MTESCAGSRQLITGFVILCLFLVTFSQQLAAFLTQRWTYGVENGAALQPVLVLLNGHAARSRERAAAYYREQRPLYQAAAKRFHLHHYFVRTASNFSDSDSSYYDLVEKRLRAMVALLKAEGRDDFRIEKDKCAMTHFFVKNRLGVPPVLRNWTSEEGFLADLRSGAAVAKVRKWPVFIKFCHLTQGSARSVRRIPSARWLHDNIDEVTEWAARLWTMRANDWTRPWYDASNLLTNVMVPGALLQGPAGVSRNPLTGKAYVVECKVEVLWGRAYIAAVFPEGLDHVEPIITRPNGTFKAEVFGNYFDVVTLRGSPMPEDAWYRWIFDEEHLQCAWELAERAARLMGIDQVRIDIFIVRGKPDECVINEDSVSSGHPYGPHGLYLAKLWYEPHKHRWYRPYKNGLPIYEQTASSVPGFGNDERDARLDVRKHKKTRDATT